MPAARRPVCVLLSGGIDSAVLLHQFLTAGHSVLPLYVRCGLSWEATELFWLRRLWRAMRHPNIQPFRVVPLPLRAIYGSHWSITGRRVPSARSRDAAVYLPGRNALLLSVAAVVATQRQIRMLAIGTLKSNPFGDGSPRFFSSMARCLSLALSTPIQILAPLRTMHKVQLIRSAAAIPLELTFSCIHPRGHRHCGRCNKCAERRRAFRAAGVADPTRYVSRAQ